MQKSTCHSEPHVATPKDVSAFCKRYMKEEGNQLYGLYKGKEVGVCPNITPSPTSVNTMVISERDDYLKHYLLPNLVRNNSSAVVIDPDAEQLYKEQRERLRAQGCKVIFIDLNTADTFFDVKSLSSERTCVFVQASSASETADYLIQWLSELYHYAGALSKAEGRALVVLPHNVHFYLGDPYYIQHEYFLLYLATCRKYGIGISYCTKSVLMLEDIFKKEVDTLYANTMATLCLDVHPRYENTLAYIKKYLTVTTTPDGKRPKHKAGVSINITLVEKCLLTDDEIQEIFKSGKALFLWYDAPPMILDKLNEEE